MKSPLSSKRKKTRAQRSRSFDYSKLEPRCLLAGIVISEFVASNTASFEDGFGSSPDWIELHNEGTTAVDLLGYHLTDDAADPIGWTFSTSTVLNPDEYLIVLASAKNVIDPAGFHHTDFKLSAGGDYLGLYDDSGVLLSEFGANGQNYPAQIQDVGYGLASGGLVSGQTVGEYLIPGNGNLGTTWTANGFDGTANGFAATRASIGYENNPGSNTSYSDEFSTEVPNGTTSVYLRTEFELDDASAINDLTVSFKYDDGFGVYLNGTLLFTENAANGLDWNSTASANHNDTDALQYVDYKIDGSTGSVGNYLNLLVDGTNTLAIHALNMPNSSDFLMVPQLSTNSISGASGYLQVPTPGAANTQLASLGPTISGVTPNVTTINPGQSVTITANVADFDRPVDAGSVELHYRIMFGSEVTLSMNDNGTGADATAGDGVYSASFTDSGILAGRLVRWYVTAADDFGSTTRAPYFFDPLNSAEYFGTVVTDTSIATDLTVLSWFVEDPNAAATNTGTRGTLFLNGEFFDNIQTDLHGQSTAGSDFPKKSFNFDANSGEKFLVSDKIGRASDFNLLTNYADQTKVRHPLAYEAFEVAGHAALTGLPVTVYRNGAYYGLFDVIEEADDEFLERAGLDRDGALYKVNNRLDDAYNNVEKKTRKYEDHTDFQEVVDANALSGTAAQIWDFDNLEMATMINYLAVNAVIQNSDIGHKNMFWYHDIEQTGQWLTLPWDNDLSFGHRWVANVSPPYFDNTLITNSNLRVGLNDLFQRISGNSRTREMFYRRMKTLSDEFYGQPGTPTADSYVGQRLEEIRTSIMDEAADDMNLWGLQSNFAAAYPFNPMEAIDQVRDVFIDERRQFIDDSGFTPTSQVGNPAIEFDNVDFDSSPVSGLQAEEYIRINNPLSTSVDISGWELTGGIQHTFRGGTVIPAGDSLFVVKDVKAFLTRAAGATGGQQNFVQGNYTGQLSSQGDTVNLVATDGAVVDVLTTPDTGQTLNQEFLRISEVNFNPSDSVANAEYIEFLNTSGSTTLNLAGVTISDGPSVPFVFPAGTTLAPGARLLVVGDTTAFTTAYPSVSSSQIAGDYAGKLSNAGELLRVNESGGEKILEFSYGDSDPWHFATDGDGQTLQLVDEFNTSLSLVGKHYTWKPSAAFNGTPGQPPISVPSVVINEILAHTDAPLVDSIELFNPTSSTIIVGDMYLSDSSADYLKYQIPTGTTIPAGGYLVFDETDFNPNPGNPGPKDFSLSASSGDQVWLTIGSGVLPQAIVAQADFGATFNGESLARFPNGSGRLLPSANLTLGGENTSPKVGPLVISEVNYHPGDPSAAALAAFPNVTDNDLEFIEIHNPTLQTIDLTNWRLRGEADFDFAAGSSLGPDDTLVAVTFDPSLTTNAALLAAFRAEYGIGTSVTIVGPLLSNLSNSFGRVSLQQPDAPPADNPTLIPHVLVDEVVYDDLAPWDVTADGTGSSLTRIAAGVRGTLAGNWGGNSPTPGSAIMESTIQSQHLFYNNSRFDIDSNAANPDDDFAVVIDKSPLRTGETATFENYTSYWHGINGLMLDVTGLKAVPTLSDFEFRIGNNNDPNSWSTAPSPTSISVRPGDGVGGTDRVSVVWADGAIKNTWLQVQLLATANTGLTNADVFYFGNVVGETGNDPATTRVNLLDVSLARSNQTGFFLGEIDNRFDFNRDQRVNLLDVSIARANQTGFVGVNLITPGTSNRNGNSDSSDGKSDNGDALLNDSSTLVGGSNQLKSETILDGKDCPSRIMTNRGLVEDLLSVDQGHVVNSSADLAQQPLQAQFPLSNRLAIQPSELSGSQVVTTNARESQNVSQLETSNLSDQVQIDFEDTEELSSKLTDLAFTSL